MHENKKKYAYWMFPSMVAEIENSLDMANATSKSDFICQAVKFYIGYLHQKKALNFISPILSATIQNEVESAERHISEMIFKVAVELGMISNLLCNVHNFDRYAVEQLRESIEEEIAATNGLITFEDAVDWQND